MNSEGGYHTVPIYGTMVQCKTQKGHANGSDRDHFIIMSNSMCYIMKCMCSTGKTGANTRPYCYAVACDQIVT